MALLEDHITILCGRRKSGKSVLALALMKEEKDKFNKIFLFSRSESSNHQYASVVDPEYVFAEYNEVFVSNLIKQIEKENKNKKDNNRNY